VVTEWEHAGGWLRERPTLRFALAGLLLPLCFLLRPPESGEFIYFQF
jgi:hypothetical protein